MSEATPDLPSFAVELRSLMHRYQTAVALSAGGTAEIYKAFDPTLERHVALKFLRRDDPQLIERMFREARAQARLDHEGICKVYEVGETDGRPYIAMQYVDGVELGVAALEMRLEEKVQVMWRVALAVHAAHQEGLIHRDLKPANIMVERSDDGEYRPVVVDFGLVWEHEAEGTAMTQAGQVLGTPPYLAPEQVEGRREDLDRRTDVYGLGATLYELLCGRPPFVAERDVDLLIKTVQEDPTPPRRLDPALSPDLETIVLKCLEKERQRRYPSARALAADLRRFLDGELISARPASLSYRLKKKVRQHRLAVSVAAAAAALLLVSVLVLRWRADERLRYEQRFARVGEDMDWTLRAVHMSSLHDIRPTKTKVRQRIEELERDLQGLSSLGQAPAHYAIGRGYAALLEDEPAQRHLERAWDLGYRGPEVAYALGLVLGRQYERLRDRASQLTDPSMRAAGLRRIESSHRDPAIAYLEIGRQADAVATEYVEALLASYESRYDEALTKLQAARQRLPWLYEAHIAEGRVHAERGDDARIRQGDTAGAWASYRLAEDAYRAAMASAGSDPRAYVGLCDLASSMLLLENQSPTGAIRSYRDLAVDACSQAVAIDGELAEAHFQQADVHRLWGKHQIWTGDNPQAALEAGLESGRQGVELAPDDSAAHIALANVHVQWGAYLNMARSGDPRPHLEEAVAGFERSLELEPNNPVALYPLGNAWWIRGMYEVRNGFEADGSIEQSVAALEAAIDLNPDSFHLYYNLAGAHWVRSWVLSERGDDPSPALEAALANRQRSVEINPDFDWGHLEIGSALAEMAHHVYLQGADPDPLMGRAMRSAHRALELNPDVGEFYNRLVTFHHQTAYYALRRGRDPTPSLDASRGRLVELTEISPERLEVYAQRLSIETLALRWALDRQRSTKTILTTADAALAEMGRFAHDSFYYSVAVDYLIWRAAAQLRAGQDPAASIERGLELAEEALAKRIEGPRFVGARGVLRFLAARATTDPKDRRDGLTRAEEDLSRALELNRWLADELDPWLSEARQLLGSGPRLRRELD